MRDVTLCFLVKEKEVCLAMKKRGFGVGKWNGVGGKVANGESVEDAALRELHEEIGVRAQHADLQPVGVLAFHYENTPELSMRTHVFFLHTWEGEPSESEEMRPRWYAHDTLPFEEMWVDDPHWLPLALGGKKIRGAFHFSADGKEIRKQKVEEINQ